MRSMIGTQNLVSNLEAIRDASLLDVRRIKYEGTLTGELNRDFRFDERCRRACTRRILDRGSGMLVGNTRAGTGFWIIEFELQPPHGEAMPNDQPQGGAPQFILQGLENFIPGVGSVIRFQAFKGLFLSRLEKGDQMVLAK